MWLVKGQDGKLLAARKDLSEAGTIAIAADGTIHFDPAYSKGEFSEVETVQAATSSIEAGAEDIDGKIAAVAGDQSASRWLREAVATLLRRDAVDAANDSEVLAELMSARARKAFELALVRRRA